MREACERGKLPVILTPHHLRHAWATHSIDAGASVRDVQEILGHNSLETTMQYVHSEIERVVSPLETL
jgi:integrase/recombinase XerC